MLRRKSGWRLRHRRWPKRSDWFRLFTCSRTCGGGLRGGPLWEKQEVIHSQTYFHSGVDKDQSVQSCMRATCRWQQKDKDQMWHISHGLPNLRALLAHINHLMSSRVTWLALNEISRQCQTAEGYLLRVQTCQLGQQEAAALCNRLFCGCSSQMTLKCKNLLFFSLRDLKFTINHLCARLLIRQGTLRIGIITEKIS